MHTSQQDELNLIIFTIDEITCGIVSHHVQEIIRSSRGITAVPRSPDYVMGIINMRGDLVSVLDLRKIFEQESNSTENQFIVIVNNQDESVGLFVDDVDDVITITNDKILHCPENLAEILKEYCEGVISYNDELVAIIDVKAVLNQNGSE